MITGKLRKIARLLTCENTKDVTSDLRHCVNASRLTAHEARDNAQYGDGMSWWTYVERVAQTSRQRDIQDRTGIDATNVTRWKGGQVPKPDMVAQFARGYGRPVLEAFVEAGFLTATEAKQRPVAAPSIDSLTDDQLLDEIRKRMRHDTAATTQAGESPANVKYLPPGPGDFGHGVAAQRDDE